MSSFTASPVFIDLINDEVYCTGTGVPAKWVAHSGNHWIRDAEEDEIKTENYFLVESDEEVNMSDEDLKRFWKFTELEWEQPEY